MIDKNEVEEQRFSNRMKSFAQVGGILLVYLGVACLFFGLAESLLLAALSLALVALAGTRGMELALRLQGGRPLPRRVAPDLWRKTSDLAWKAGLPCPPDIYFSNSAMPNAFAIGTRRRSAICVSRGLLELLDDRELQAALAHEVAHIRNGDSFSLGASGQLGDMARVFSWLGVALLALSWPSYLAQGLAFPWVGLVALLAAPSLITMLQLAFSRSREFAADIGAVELAADPIALCSALAKLERASGFFLRRYFLPMGQSSWLSTHPATSERIRRLESMRRRDWGLPAWVGEALRGFMR
ncbi:zinc metalloprotease HtpX [Pelagicoccus sp. SDUM812003]|uniref:zinc metalloprotease HtpX n=1 Tax=Pelagicoccus sp. SDUM812003 TaxID=3041267 RepID=UPI00280DD92C|nr:zinc metalloprotease HtpX [Pelagicoccus sp. SDUM812003]MDQ8202640.1 zinc metalloprotease HtpX [Pelagicoccus sp. SDUM812003]